MPRLRGFDPETDRRSVLKAGAEFVENWLVPALTDRYLRTPPHDPSDPLADISIPLTRFSQFGSAVLGLGDIDEPSIDIKALAAIFDLEGFTAFAEEADAHLIVPDFLHDFLSWLFETIRELSKARQEGDRIYLYCPLPVWAKFTGDGVLLLWSIDDAEISAFCRQNKRDRKTQIQGDIGNIILVLYNVCRRYWEDFYLRIPKSSDKVPKRLRCGAAQGSVYSVGSGLDYVGSCINMAARLQKLGRLSRYLSLCILQKGIDIEHNPVERQISLSEKRQLSGAPQGGELSMWSKRNLIHSIKRTKPY